MLCGRQVLFLCAFYGFFDFCDCFVGVFTCFDDCDNQVNQSLELFVRHFVHVVSFPALASLCRAVSRDASRRFGLSPASHHQAGPSKSAVPACYTARCCFICFLKCFLYCFVFGCGGYCERLMYSCLLITKLLIEKILPVIY